MKHLRTVLVAIFIPSLAWAQGPSAADAKIRNAMRAAPESISAHATIMDWPASEGAAPVQLRAGTNGWTCFPDFPGSEGDDPQCLDEAFMAWVNAYISRTTPSVSRIGIGYMIAPGGASNSNTDPFAAGPTMHNEWGHDPPHLMLVVPDSKVLEGLPTKRENGGPWVMWQGTPYVHVMIPIQGGGH